MKAIYLNYLGLICSIVSMIPLHNWNTADVIFFIIGFIVAVLNGVIIYKDELDKRAKRSIEKPQE